MITLAPASARAWTQARPIAWPPPVTSAVRPSSLYLSRYTGFVLTRPDGGAAAGPPPAHRPADGAVNGAGKYRPHRKDGRLPDLCVRQRDHGPDGGRCPRPAPPPVVGR